MADGRPLIHRSGPGAEPVGRTPTVLVRQDGTCAYPVLDEVPVLLAPERLVSPVDGPFGVDVEAPQYAEAYEEMDFYSSAAQRAEGGLADSHELRRLRRVADLSPADRRLFPTPADLWLDATYETTAQWHVYRRLAPLDGKTVLQVGGKGLHAVTLLLAGAVEAWVLSPMVDELRHAKVLAGQLGLADRLHVVAGVAEELPLAQGYFDAVYTISLHHTVTALSFPELARILRPGGVLAAVEPWRAPLYRIGTGLLGKRSPEVHCRPMTRERLEPFFAAFASAEAKQYGSLLRYPMLALWKFGVQWRLTATHKVARFDDVVSSFVPGLRRWGSCASLVGAADG